MQMKGWIALDIDGTITHDKYSVPQEVIDYLRGLHKSGWRIALATGRAFAFASIALQKFDFPFILLPQNGSVALQMPGKRLLFKKYMRYPAISAVENSYQGNDADYLVYAGYDRGDLFYWRPSRFYGEDLEYVHELLRREKEKSIEVQQFDPEALAEFPLVKCFGPSSRMGQVAERLRAAGLFHVAKIRDPFHDHYQLLLVTDRGASKGASLQEAFRMLGRGAKVIAAGDDENDLSLLEVADVKIAMAHAPDFVQKAADLIAPPTSECGIIRALQMALRNDC